MTYYNKFRQVYLADSNSQNNYLLSFNQWHNIFFLLLLQNYKITKRMLNNNNARKTIFLTYNIFRGSNYFYGQL